MPKREWSPPSHPTSKYANQSHILSPFLLSPFLQIMNGLWTLLCRNTWWWNSHHLVKYHYSSFRCIAFYNCELRVVSIPGVNLTLDRHVISSLNTTVAGPPLNVFTHAMNFNGYRPLPAGWFDLPSFCNSTCPPVDMSSLPKNRPLILGYSVVTPFEWCSQNVEQRVSQWLCSIYEVSHVWELEPLWIQSGN